VQWTQGNLFGRNLTFTAVGKADFPYSRFQVRDCPVGTIDPSQCGTKWVLPEGIPIERVLDLGLSVPRLYPITDALRAGIDLIHERAIRPSYDLTKFSAQYGMDLTRRTPVTAGFAYEIGYQELAVNTRSIEDVLAGIDQRIFRLPPGHMWFGSLRPYVLLDLRDSPIRPRSGLLFSLNTDYMRSFQGSEAPEVGQIHVNLLKLQGLAASYLPLPAYSSIVFSARAGRVFQLDEFSHTPGDRRFYLGGATSLRGFHEDAVQPQDLIDQLHAQVRACEATLTDFGCTPQAQLLAAGGTSNGGDQFVSFTAELRTSFTESFEAAFFWDAGNLWSTPTNIFQHLVLRHAVGTGLRWLTPIGRIAFDIGFNLAPDPLLGEPQYGFYFSINPI
jgi:outer membrane protein insertion porin family